MADPAVETVSVTKIYNRGKPNEVTAVKDASLKIDEGSLAVLKGPSGSGKTTILSLIGCLTAPTRGEVVILGKKVSKLPERFRNQHKRCHIGFIFQHFQLIGDMSVLDNIVLPLLPEGISPKKRNKRADRLLEQFNLTHRRHFKVHSLSGGEQQKLALARALATDPQVLLLDEPCASIDSASTLQIETLLRDSRERGVKIILVTHDIGQARRLADDIVFMHRGRICEHNPAERFFNAPASSEARAYLEGKIIV